jgi:hypothetical protein
MSELSDREFVEYWRTHYVSSVDLTILGAGLLNRLRALANTDNEISVPALCDLAELRLDLAEKTELAAILKRDCDEWEKRAEERLQQIAEKDARIVALEAALAEARHSEDCASLHPSCPDCGSSNGGPCCNGFYRGTTLIHHPCDCWKAVLAAPAKEPAWCE